MEEIDGGGISRTQKATPKVPEQGDTSKGPWAHFGRSETTDDIKCDWKKMRFSWKCIYVSLLTSLNTLMCISVQLYNSSHHFHWNWWSPTHTHLSVCLSESLLHLRIRIIWNLEPPPVQYKLHHTYLYRQRLYFQRSPFKSPWRAQMEALLTPMQWGEASCLEMCEWIFKEAAKSQRCFYIWNGICKRMLFLCMRLGMDTNVCSTLTSRSSPIKGEDHTFIGWLGVTKWVVLNQKSRQTQHGT